MKYYFENICSIVNGRVLQLHQNDLVEHLVLDSRKITTPLSSLFFALEGPRRDGHEFIREVYGKGVRNFVVSERVDLSGLAEGNFVFVNDVLDALQQLVAYHRKQFNIPVIGITGSNGKTIVKEWLYQLLSEKFNIVRSPKSYNSQIGVPLSVWQMNIHHELAIFEAGISQPGEMEKLEKIIQPTIGILTNVGEAHSENFINREEKLTEKLKLFSHASKVIANGDDAWITKQMMRKNINSFFWGRNNNSDLQVLSVEKENDKTTLSVNFRNETFNFSIPFTDDASVENAITCCSFLQIARVERSYLEEKMSRLQPVNMRLELKKGVNHCSIINDSYSADLSSLIIALNFLDQQAGGSKRTVILSDFLQTGHSDENLYKEIAKLLQAHKIDKVIGIGAHISQHLRFNLVAGHPIALHLFNSVEEFIQQFRSTNFKEETILVKGARVFQFERITSLLEQKVHQTVLEINLNAIVHNLKEYQKSLNPSTKLMAMVKAFAYGSGGAEIAGILQYHKADYLGVAYADEGVELRKSGINLPIMVMNPEESSFDAIVEHELEPDIYSFDLLKQFDSFLKGSALQQYPIHIEIETGMNRLGFDIEDMKKLAKEINQTDSFKVQTVFSHLAASEDPSQDEFTMQQYEKFIQASKELEKELGYLFLKHIANSAAILRLPDLQLDMVRLGIGMYGIDTTGTASSELQTVATLRSTVAQLKHVKAGESVSYNRKGIVRKDSLIATVRIGYADGYPRRLGNGKGKMFLKTRLAGGQGKLAPVIGNVCMDMTMIDVTNINGIEEGDEVIIFGGELPIQKIAEWAGTIPYEIMTGISQRVKRIYFEE